jgi:hypothetical protein
MKGNFALALFTMALLMSLAACSKNNNSSPEISATIGGSAFSNSLEGADARDLTADQLIDITAEQDQAHDTVYLSFVFPDSSSVGTLNFNLAGRIGIEYLDINGTFQYDSSNPHSHGSLELTTYDKTNKKVAGSFSGVIYGALGDSVVITNGKFNINYITQ